MSAPDARATEVIPKHGSMALGVGRIIGGVSGGARDRVPGPALDQRTPSRAAPPVPGATVSGARSAAAVLALQRAAGNAATLRALGLQRRLLQRAPVHRVMPLEHNFFYGQNKEHGYTVKPAINRGIPAGYHVTIYPALSLSQSIAALSGDPLGMLPDYGLIEFTRFNVTREDNRRAHYYFDDQGHVVWAQTKTEASLEDPHWDDAVQAALAIYGSLGVNVTAQGLYDQLHVMGRSAPVSGADTYGRPTPAPQPVATGSSLKFIPPQLRRGKPPAQPQPASQTAPATVPAQQFVPPAQPQAIPLYQWFVPSGWVPPPGWAPPQQPFAQPTPFTQPPQPFQNPLFPQPPVVRTDVAPVFEHEDEMDLTDITDW
jgi:hypothetical protein